MIEYRVDGNMIRDMRKKHGLTVPVLAEKMATSAQYLYRIERNEDRPSFEFLLQIAAALEVPYTLFLERNTSTAAAKLSVGSIEFDVPEELVEPFLKIINEYKR